jgi:hypothetical protein
LQRVFAQDEREEQVVDVALVAREEDHRAAPRGVAHPLEARQIHVDARVDLLGEGLGDGLQTAQDPGLRRGFESEQHAARALFELGAFARVRAAHLVQDRAQLGAAQDLFSHAIVGLLYGSQDGAALVLEAPQERDGEPARRRSALALAEGAEVHRLARAHDAVFVVQEKLRARAQIAGRLDRPEHHVEQREAEALGALAPHHDLRHQRGREAPRFGEMQQGAERRVVLGATAVRDGRALEHRGPVAEKKRRRLAPREGLE